ncbi:MAG: LytTR family DNA-binding domain-containing protein [Flavitalea sp.]
MKKISCIIIDDEPIACKGIQEYVSQVDFLDLIGVFDDALSAHQLVSSNAIQLIFLDIEMPGMTGIDFLNALKVAPYVIFTTAWPNYALQGFELGVVDYLVKPIAFPRFLKAVNKVRDLVSAFDNNNTVQADQDSFFVKDSGRFIRIHYHEILFVEALQNYVAIYLTGRKLICYVTLSMIEKELPTSIFMKVHKSYIISLKKIDAIEGNLVKIGVSEVPVSRTLKDELMKKVVDDRLLKR